MPHPAQRLSGLSNPSARQFAQIDSLCEFKYSCSRDSTYETPVLGNVLALLAAAAAAATAPEEAGESTPSKTSIFAGFLVGWGRWVCVCVCVCVLRGRGSQVVFLG